MSKKGSIFRGALLVTGTTMGGGMLALPVVTGLGGFIPSIVLYSVCWLFMTSTALLMMEAYLWMDSEVNLVTMAERTLGKWGKGCAWLLYLFLFYSLTLAYVVGCGQLLGASLDGAISDFAAAVVFAFLFIPVVYFGPRFASRFNLVMMLGFGLSFSLFLVLGVGQVNVENLTYQNWVYSLGALPIAFTAFAFHGMVPTLSRYLGNEAPRIRKAILLGSAIPFFSYIIWSALIQGIVPVEGELGLLATQSAGMTAVAPLKVFIDSPHVFLIGECFAFFALVTSLIGVALGLVDFLSDGLGVKRTPIGKMALCLMIFVPVLFMVALKPGLFLGALDLAGGYGCAILLGLFPILMVWAGRYRHGLTGKYTFPGGKIVLCALIAFVVFEVIFETVQLLV